MKDSINQSISEALGIEPIPTPSEPSGEPEATPEPLLLPAPGVPFLEGSQGDVNTAVAVVSSDIVEMDEDFAEARTNIKKIIQTTDAAIERCAVIAEESESPRAFEVLEKLLRHSLDANDRLLDISKKRKEIKKNGAGGTSKSATRGGVTATDTPEQQAINIERAVFVGSTSELDEFIKKHAAPSG